MSRIGLLSGLLLIAGIALSASRPAEAAGIDCAKAATATENAICADSGLGQLDSRLARLYNSVLAATTVGEAEDGAAHALQGSQRAWLAERDRCAGDAVCINGAYRRRLGVLSGSPDSLAAGPIDRFLGNFTREAEDAPDRLSIRILRLDGQSAAVLIEAPARPAACTRSAVGHIDEQKRFVLSPADRALVVTDTATGISVAGATDGVCPGGDLAGAYQRRDATADAGDFLVLDLATDFGPLTLELDEARHTVTGRYTDYRGGRMFGVLENGGHSFVGIWIQSDAGSPPCAVRRQGSASWGRIAMIFPDQVTTGGAMSGRWAYCADEPNGAWDGQITKSRTESEPRSP